MDADETREILSDQALMTELKQAEEDIKAGRGRFVVDKIEEIYSNQFDLVWPIFKEVVAKADNYPYPPDLDFEAARDLWFASGARVYAAYLGDEIVATRYMVPNKVGLGSHVANTGMMVDGKYRGQGIGKTMMQFAIDEAKRLGYRALQLNLVVTRNQASIKICQQFGFEIIGILPGAFYYKQQEYVDAYVMYKSLAQ